MEIQPRPGCGGPDLPTTSAFHVLCKPIGPLCNLRCEHCFYLDKVSLFPRGERFRMSDPTLQEFIRQYIWSQPSEAPEVGFAWQGGEPTLMGLDFFRRVVELQRRYARPGQRIANALQTNGTRLDEDWGIFLREEAFLVGISIDGPAPLHDRYRVDGRGRGSLDAALRGLGILRRHGVEFNTLTCVQRHNGNHPERVYDFLREIGSRFMQFIPIVEHAGDGGLTKRSVHARQFGRFLNRVFDRWQDADIGEVFVQHFDMMLALVMGHPASLCVHAETCGRNVALEHNGDVFACDHFVEVDHLLGNLEDTPLARLLDSDAATRFGAEKSSQLPRHCRRCRYLRFCHGGCPAHRVGTAPGGESGLNHLCQGYLLFYAHTLPRFEAMAAALRSGRPARDYHRFLTPGSQEHGSQISGSPRRPGATPSNAPCPCGSGRKHKRCCGRAGRTADPALRTGRGPSRGREPGHR